MHNYILTFAFAAFAIIASNAQASPQSRESIIRNATTELGHTLVTSHATFDGALVTGLRQTATCEAVIATTKTSTTVRWKELGSLPARIQNGQKLFFIPIAGHPHILAVRNGRLATGVDMGLGLLDESCGGSPPA